MITTYIRSSSYANFDYCQLQYYLTYVLGIERVAGKKADKGTVVHKVLESLAVMKKNHQTSGKYFIEDDIIGILNCSDDDFLCPVKLTYEEVCNVNSSRINKYTYLTPCSIEYGHIRYGIPLVEELIIRAYNYYKERSAEKWTNVDFKDCTNFVWMALDYKDGMFDPRRRDIVDAEPHFDFVIEEDWAHYDWEMPSGKKESGFLGIKGTVDLITDLGNGIFEVVDWKTGQAKNWATGNVKKYNDICTDTQLMLYNYAIRQMYKDVENSIVSIFFIRHGGPFTVAFNDTHIDQLKDRIRKRFQEIKSCDLPVMLDPTQQDFRCKICDYSKKQSPTGESNICRFIHDKIREIGIDETTRKYINPSFTIGTYDAPGE